MLQRDKGGKKTGARHTKAIADCDLDHWVALLYSTVSRRITVRESKYQG
jgi:hypothetical protein